MVREGAGEVREEAGEVRRLTAVYLPRYVKHPAPGSVQPFFRVVRMVFSGPVAYGYVAVAYYSS